jgi:hypothetical protein
MKSIKTFLLLIGILLLTMQSFAAQYIVSFKSKGMSFHESSYYFSQNSINKKNKRNIAFDELDLPVNEDYINSIKSLNIQILAKSKWLNCV